MNKPPEKIYLQWEHYDEDATIYLNDVTWCVDKINEDDVEYIRADLFTDAQIEVALELSRLCEVIDSNDK